jgi:hypothetical protein
MAYMLVNWTGAEFIGILPLKLRAVSKSGMEISFTRFGQLLNPG